VGWLFVNDPGTVRSRVMFLSVGSNESNQSTVCYGALACLPRGIRRSMWNDGGGPGRIGALTSANKRTIDGWRDDYYYRARYLHTQLGRFTSRNLIGYAARTNFFEYTASRVVTYTDATGLTGHASRDPVSATCAPAVCVLSASVPDCLATVC
jgi:RHS repeat-associated protein